MSSSTTPSWCSEINVRRKGAGYFLSQRGRLRFDPADYIAFRALPRDFSEMLIQEWAQWMCELKQSQHESVRRAAGTAQPLNTAALNTYYQNALLKNRAFEAMETSVEQVTAAEKTVTRLLQKEFETVERASIVLSAAPVQCEPSSAEGDPCIIIQSKSTGEYSASSPSVWTPLSSRPGKRTAAPMEQTSYKKRSGDGEEEVQDDENAQSSAQELQDSQDASAGAGAAAAAQKGLQKVVSSPIVSSSTRVSFGRNLAIEDLVCLRKGSNLLSDDENDYLSNATPPLYSPRNILGPDLPSSDPADPDFQEDWGLELSTSRLYTWDYLHGPGRVDSGVKSHWVCNGVEVGRDLLSFRDRIVDNNGGICDPYEML